MVLWMMVPNAYTGWRFTSTGSTSAAHRYLDTDTIRIAISSFRYDTGFDTYRDTPDFLSHTFLIILPIHSQPQVIKYIRIIPINCYDYKEGKNMVTDGISFEKMCKGDNDDNNNNGMHHQGCFA